MGFSASIGIKWEMRFFRTSTVIVHCHPRPQDTHTRFSLLMCSAFIFLNSVLYLCLMTRSLMFIRACPKSASLFFCDRWAQLNREVQIGLVRSIMLKKKKTSGTKRFKSGSRVLFMYVRIKQKAFLSCVSICAGRFDSILLLAIDGNAMCSRYESKGTTSI